jgi:hypothetical protein
LISPSNSALPLIVKTESELSPIVTLLFLDMRGFVMLVYRGELPILMLVPVVVVSTVDGYVGG